MAKHYISVSWNTTLERFRAHKRVVLYRPALFSNAALFTVCIVGAHLIACYEYMAPVDLLRAQFLSCAIMNQVWPMVANS